ncbi:IclR family transcriptional regulator [Dactylosporangium salmoneum]|uniref:IclR family transcriptional regulator n=1 Tax=Dactylosporangium salmoneum TaxID=53361 RepID=A0ABP5TEX4_9ACTN
MAAILLAFTEVQGAQGVSELSRRLALPKSAVHRTLDALTSTGLVAQDPATGKYLLGPRALELGMTGFGAPDLRTLAEPVMRELMERTHETVTLSYRVQDERVYVSQVESKQPVRMTVTVGQRFPLYAGASGRAILAAMSAEDLERYLSSVELLPLTRATVYDRDQLLGVLEEVRQGGFAVSFGERDPWAAATAAAVTAGGRPIGAISVCGPLARFQGAVVSLCSEAVRDAARRISDLLSGGGTVPDPRRDAKPAAAPAPR